MVVQTQIEEWYDIVCNVDLSLVLLFRISVAAINLWGGENEQHVGK
jgi:hypothetical protein